MDLVAFELEGQRYALPMERVIELAMTVRWHPLPGAPPAVLGMVNHAGAPLPLIDMRKVLGAGGAERSEAQTWNDHLVICQSATRAFALRVDRAIGLVQVADTAINEGMPSRHLKGVAVLSETDLLYIQDLDALLSLDEERQLAHAIDQSQADAGAFV